MFDQLTNEGMLDRLFIDWCTYKNKSVWKHFLTITCEDKSSYDYELWRKWVRL